MFSLADNSSKPTITLRPFFSNISIPTPLTKGLGSLVAITTFDIPLSINKEAHEGFLPTKEHGSKVT